MWDAGTVKIALIEAFEILDIVGGSWKPKGFGSAHPEMLRDKTDYNESVDLHEAAGAYWAEMQSARRKKLHNSKVPSAVEVQRMEFIVCGGKNSPNWLSFLSENTGAKNCLQAYVLYAAKAKKAGRGFSEAKMCRKLGWNENTYASRRDLGAKIIALKLNHIGVPCWAHSETVDGDRPQDATKPPVAEVLLLFIEERPRTRAQCISFAFSQGIIASRDKPHCVKVALTKLVRQNRVQQNQAGLFLRVG